MTYRQAQMEAAAEFHAHEMDVGPCGWERWITKAEKLAGHDLDGNNTAEAQAAGTADGYSYDDAMAAYDAGSTAAAYVASIRVPA